MKNEIAHIGTVVSIEERQKTASLKEKRQKTASLKDKRQKTIVKVAVQRSEACSACRAKGLCQLHAEMMHVPVEVKDEALLKRLKVGDKVTVTMNGRSGWKALTMAYIVPLVLLVVGILVSDRLGWSEELSVGVSLGAIAVYFGILWIFRKRLDGLGELIIDS